MATLVDRLHHARPPASDDCEPAPGQRGAERYSCRVVRVVRFGACRTEHGDRGPNAVEGVEAFDELREDAKDAPRVGVVAQLLDRAALEQHSVGRRGLSRDNKATSTSA